ncbi:calcium-activated chloride channel regulator 1-like [Apostichopus japonicus]|uniref:calcium-activated chloride channel regulator 1-like n=1 Tax=Stichopus japonicus TaxID=307972 RepID=UPI003AB7E4ED
MQSGVKEYDRRIELFADSAVYGVSESKRHGVYLDPTVGVKTSFDFSYLVETAFSAIDVIIKSPSGRVFTNDSYEGYGVDLTFKVVSVKFEFAETGFWSYEVFNRHTSEHEVFVSISTYASQEGVDPIIATSELSGSITDFANGQPLIAFSEVRQGFNPVIRANVTATIERPDANGNRYESIMLQLLDNGAGADVVKDDGIYSRYFTEFTGVGYYGIKININNDDGTAIILNNGDLLSFSRALSYVEPEELLEGNIPKIGDSNVYLPGMPVPETKGEVAPPFTRGISGGSSRVPETPAGWEPGDDIIAPSKIVDLLVTSSSYNNGTVTLEFTSPGDDLDRGNASFYSIRVSTSLTELRTNYGSATEVNETDILIGDLNTPGNFGDREIFVIQVAVPRNENVVSYVFAMHAVDEEGNSGGMSNVVQATLRKYIPTPPESRNLALYIAMGVLGVIVILMVCLVGGVVLVRRLAKGDQSVVV